MVNTEPSARQAALLRTEEDFRWEGVPLKDYKEQGNHFRDITKQILFLDPHLQCELRYFEIGPGGHSSFERHEHVHAVMVIRGAGRCLVGEEVLAIKAFDLVTVPPQTWHQFQANASDTLGFLCLVNCERDRPHLPTADELAALRANPVVAQFIKVAERDV